MVPYIGGALEAFVSLSYEQLLITNELSEIIRWHNQCLDRLHSYRESYPYLLAPNLAKMMEENLKENVQMLYRELNNLHKPKTEQRRHVCRQCHSVFAMALPGGICDQCRSKGSQAEGAYRMATPLNGALQEKHQRADEDTAPGFEDEPVEDRAPSEEAQAEDPEISGKGDEPEDKTITESDAAESEEEAPPSSS